MSDNGSLKRILYKAIALLPKKQLHKEIDLNGKACYNLLLLHQLNRKEFMRRIIVARQGRNRKKGRRLSRISDAVLRRRDKQKNSRFIWWSNKSKTEE